MERKGRLEELLRSRKPTKEMFEASQVRHLNVAVEQLLHRWGVGLR